ncbi:MAG: hypothetical protein CML18_01535 [Pusillimonas sp.]|nr:hypothetical protein [Pusillimonas sp.]|tara:strand:+ start:58497 stop:58904 length:408 start_codon:yes stop_codon:yes gene_type:complete
MQTTQTFIPIKTSELVGIALNWAVATCEQYKLKHLKGDRLNELHLVRAVDMYAMGGSRYSPSTNYAQIELIIGKLPGFILKKHPYSDPERQCEAQIFTDNMTWVEYGPTPLIALMRCYVSKMLGDVVQIPEELLA